MDINSKDSTDKLKNMFYPSEDKTSNISLLLQKEVLVKKNENKKPENKIEKMSKEKILNIKEDKRETHDENTKIKIDLPCIDRKNIVNLEEAKRCDNKDMININNEQNESNYNFILNDTFKTKNENHDKNFAKFTLSIKENNIIHNNEESTKNIKKTLFGNLFVSNKESDLSNIFTNEKASIKISGIDNKKDLFGNNICNDNKISLINNHDNFNNLFQKENNKEEFIEFELIYKYKPNEKPDEYEILYHLINKQNKIEKNKKLKILGQSFIINNKDKCKIIYKNKEYELQEYFEDIDNNYKNKAEISFIFRIIKNVNFV